MKSPEIPNDAHLVQLVRGALGRSVGRRDTQRVNISSCGRVVTLHGVVDGPEERRAIEAAARRTPGVLDVVDKLSVAGHAGR